jgi:hypothetical protein
LDTLINRLVAPTPAASALSHVDLPTWFLSTSSVRPENPAEPSGMLRRPNPVHR